MSRYCELVDEKSSDLPTLKIIEEPEQTWSFRHESEMQDKHGFIKGIKTDKTKKKLTYPTVVLQNYSEEALITCTPYCDHKDNGEKIIHPYRLLNENRQKFPDYKLDPLEYVVNKEHEYKAFIRASVVIPGKKSKYMREEIIDKKECGMQKLYLCFQAFEYINKIKGKELCEKVFSNPIGNQRSSSNNKLKIVDMSLKEGDTKGGIEIFLFCERIDPKDIRIRFSKENFIAYATIVKVHYQTAIKFITPSFEDEYIKSSVVVDVQLERESDGALSKPFQFKYKPSLKRNICSNNNELKSSASNGKIMKNYCDMGTRENSGMALTLRHEYNFDSDRYKLIDDIPSSLPDEIIESDPERRQDLNRLQIGEPLLHDEKPAESFFRLEDTTKEDTSIEEHLNTTTDGVEDLWAEPQGTTIQNNSNNTIDDIFSSILDYLEPSPIHYCSDSILPDTQELKRKIYTGAEFVVNNALRPLTAYIQQNLTKMRLYLNENNRGKKKT